jgi:hypothetical protein
MDTIYEYKDAFSHYLSDPGRVRQESSLRGCIDYANPRVTTSILVGGVWGLGLGEGNSKYSADMYLRVVDFVKVAVILNMP